ncbi:MAG: hypothetical protein AAF663_12120, partial [Planctomycetota bacterium]
EWAIVDSIHLERATQNYPHTNGSNLYAPNPADQINPSLESSGRGQWVQLNNLWAPSRVGAPFAYRPANVQHVDPSTGEISQIVAVPAARYEGNEDGRGGFGALQYEQVFEQYRQLNTDPNHPMFVLLHHDGDNFGGGSESYYGGNYQNFVNWVGSNPNYNASTAQDYLDRFPVPDDYVVHVENGSWAGADNGDPEFKKWLGDPDPNTGWSPDRNSWAVLTAAKNHVYTADDLNPVGQTDASRDRIIAGNGNAVERAWHTLLQAQASDHWYWDGTEVWDSNVTKGSNAAIASVSSIINGLNEEDTAPTVFVPQRESYNPGGFEWGHEPESSDFEVWTFAYDVSGLTDVKLKYRIDGDGFNPLDSIQNETYAGGGEVGGWMELMMDASDVIPPAGAVLAATQRAPKYSAMITGLDDVLVDYYVEATDAWGNVTRTDIQHVYVGQATPGSGGGDPTGGTGEFVMDGVLDAGVTAVGSSEDGTQTLYADMREGKLYVATESASGDRDVFIYLQQAIFGGFWPLTDANWAKAGQVTQWETFLGDEGTNDWEGWFDAEGTTEQAGGPGGQTGGGYLEGTIDVFEEFGTDLSSWLMLRAGSIQLSAGVFESADGGVLLPESSVGDQMNGDANLREFILVRLNLLMADIDGDG